MPAEATVPVMLRALQQFISVVPIGSNAAWNSARILPANGRELNPRKLNLSHRLIHSNFDQTYTLFRLEGISDHRSHTCNLVNNTWNLILSGPQPQRHTGIRAIQPAKKPSAIILLWIAAHPLFSDTRVLKMILIEASQYKFIEIALLLGVLLVWSCTGLMLSTTKA